MSDFIDELKEMVVDMLRDSNKVDDLFYEISKVYDDFDKRDELENELFDTQYSLKEKYRKLGEILGISNN